MKRKIAVAISDTHGGHRLGLCSPNVLLNDNVNGQLRTYSPQLSYTQQFMYDSYIEWQKEIMALAGKDDVIVIHDGDPTHGKASFLELMTSKLADQELIAQANMESWLQYKNVKAMRFGVGTGIHELGEGSSSEIIANALSGKYPKVDIKVVYHGLLNFDGFTIDYAHHGPFIGSRTWLKGNELRYYLRSIMMSEIMEGRTPPNLILRGHYHVYHREFLEIKANGNVYESWAILLPGFTFKDDYTRRATKSEFKQTIGMVAFEIIDGHLYKTHPLTQTVDVRTVENL